jgi:hypothetical protein
VNTHVRILGILQVVYASIHLLLGLGVLALFGGIATAISLSAEARDAVFVAPLMASIGTIGGGVLIAFAVPRLIAGIGLLKQRPWARALTLVVSALGLLDAPIGTLLGIYGLVVMFRADAGQTLAPASAPMN